MPQLIADAEEPDADVEALGGSSRSKVSQVLQVLLSDVFEWTFRVSWDLSRQLSPKNQAST